MNNESDNRFRIGLNAQLLSGDQSYRSAGIHGYISGLMGALPASDDRFDYVVYTSQKKTPMNGSAQLVTTRDTSANPMARILWEQISQPVMALQNNVDLLHGLAFVTPLFSTKPRIVTVYDLSFVKRPTRVPASRRAYLSLFTRLACRNARRVIAISNSTRHDLVEVYGIEPARVDVAYPGVSDHFRRADKAAIADFRQQHGLPDRFILYLGTIEPRKNLSALIRAYHKLRPAGVKLICAGGKGWLYEDVFQTVEELHLTRDVIFPGYVPDKDLPLWYSAASVFAFPSSYEGFGIPVIEALACGAPTLTTNVSSLPEAAGDVALTVDPNDEDALAAGLNRLLTDDALRDRAHDHGPHHAAQFSWSATAQATTDSYARALNLAPASPSPG